jgi:hypothetical protein
MECGAARARKSASCCDLKAQPARACAFTAAGAATHAGTTFHARGSRARSAVRLLTGSPGFPEAGVLPIKLLVGAAGLCPADGRRHGLTDLAGTGW